jgi:uncharacterized DUF497 family protein
MQFEWDEAKNIENIRKHEIDFADVPTMFDGEMLIELDDRFDYGEDRWFGIGFLGSGIAVVVWTERQKNGFFVTCYGSIGWHKSTKSLSGERFN